MDIVEVQTENIENILKLYWKYFIITTCRITVKKETCMKNEKFFTVYSDRIRSDRVELKPETSLFIACCELVILSVISCHYWQSRAIRWYYLIKFSPFASSSVSYQLVLVISYEDCKSQRRHFNSDCKLSFQTEQFLTHFCIQYYRESHMSAFDDAIESQVSLPKGAPVKVYDHEIDQSKYSNKLIPRYFYCRLKSFSAITYLS